METQDYYLETRALLMRAEVDRVRSAIVETPRIRVFRRRGLELIAARFAGAERELWRAIGKKSRPPVRIMGDG